MKHLLAVAALLAIAYGLNLQTRPPAPVAIHAASQETDQTAIARGRAVYTRYGCVACHGDDGKGGFANANAETDGRVPGVIYVAEGYTRNELRRKVLDGLATVGKKDPRGPRPPFRMPGWAGQMSNDELGDLVEYLFSLYPNTETQKWR